MTTLTQKFYAIEIAKRAVRFVTLACAWLNMVIRGHKGAVAG